MGLIIVLSFVGRDGVHRFCTAPQIKKEKRRPQKRRITYQETYNRKSAKKQQGIEKEGRQLRSKVQFLVANCVNVSLIHLPVAWYGGETK